MFFLCLKNIPERFKAPKKKRCHNLKLLLHLCRKYKFGYHGSRQLPGIYGWVMSPRYEYHGLSCRRTIHEQRAPFSEKQISL